MGPSRLSSSTSAISSNALAWQRLINRISVCLKSMTSSLVLTDRCARVEKAIRQLAASNHSPHIWCSKVVPAQNREYALLARKRTKKARLAKQTPHKIPALVSTVPATSWNSPLSSLAIISTNSNETEGHPSRLLHFSISWCNVIFTGLYRQFHKEGGRETKRGSGLFIIKRDVLSYKHKKRHLL